MSQRPSLRKRAIKKVVKGGGRERESRVVKPGRNYVGRKDGGADRGLDARGGGGRQAGRQHAQHAHMGLGWKLGIWR